MAQSILPSGEELHVTPAELLKYLNPDGLRQMMRQERLRWNLKPNKDVDYIDPKTLRKHTGELHNNGKYQRMQIRTYPDNGALEGYAGIQIDSGLFGIEHDLEKWDESMTKQSQSTAVNRMAMGAMARIPDTHGFGLDASGKMSEDTDQRMAMFMCDPADGRVYLYSNDGVVYTNNETRKESERLPGRTVARIADIPTRITQLMNDLDFVSDPDYRHTDNNFTNSNRYILDNLDDRTFVYPEIAKDSSGEYVENRRVGLGGDETYGECDGEESYNTQPDLGENPDLGDYGDRLGEGIHSYNANKTFSGVRHASGYFPGIFRSLEELERVDLVDQLRAPMTQQDTPGAKRPYSFYVFDGKWSPNWFDRYQYNDSYLAQSLNPYNMEIEIPGAEPVPYNALDQSGSAYSTAKLYQWRYNRVTLKYSSTNIRIDVVASGTGYVVGDILRWSFGDDVFLFKVTKVGSAGQIQEGTYYAERERIFEQDPSTHGVGIPFSNMTGTGHDALLSVHCPVTIENHAAQIKNNLYAYVDITPTVRSDNSTPWSDTHLPDSQDGRITVRSTAPGPGYTGINSGRGGPAPTGFSSASAFHEHGGNATAGVHVHLFRYVIDTQNPSWVIRDGIQVFLGRWVDQGPMGVERPCDIKALFLSNPDTNNFNNYYKFMLDSLLDTMNRNPDAISTNDRNALTQAYLHIDSVDPESDLKFYQDRFDPDTCEYKQEDVTARVIYVNASTGITFVYNGTYKNDPSYGYGMRAPGWIALAGATAR